MRIMFCGHRDDMLSIVELSRLREALDQLLTECKCAEFYCGEYGNFDFFCRRVVQGYQNSYPWIRIALISPYENKKHEKIKEEFDRVIIPPIENVPKKYAILKRNFWMVEQSDVVIACVRRCEGGAMKTLEYAVKKGKRIIYLNGDLSN